MWPNFFTGFPFPFPTLGRANFNTLPTVAVTVGTENVTLELPNHAFRNRDYVGGFYINLRQAIPAGTTATLPILIGTNGDTRPLLAYNNEPVTVENIAGTGIYEIHYKEAQELSNRLQQIASYERWNNNNSYEMHFNPFYRFLSRIINLNVFASNVAKTIDEKCTYPSFKIANMSSKQAWILACAAIENNINLEDCYTPVWAR